LYSWDESLFSWLLLVFMVLCGFCRTFSLKDCKSRKFQLKHNLCCNHISRATKMVVFCNQIGSYAIHHH
ncbi:MAG: hypothetical protein ACK5BJ_11410, partial [Bacteroidota bacterium]